MPGLLAHCLVAMALQGALGLALGLPALSWGMFAAGIIAMLADIDSTGIPPHRTPFGHSAPFAFLWSYSLFAAAAIIAPPSAPEFALAASVAFGSHLLLDAFTKGGIFTLPRTRRVPDWLRAVPAGLLRLDGMRYLNADEAACTAFLDGMGTWTGWGRLSLGKGGSFEGGGRLNAALCCAGLAGVIGLVAAG